MKTSNLGPMGKLVQLTQSVRKSDAWSNIFTGLGLAKKDKRLGADVNYKRFSETEAETLYACDDIAGKVVDIPPEEGTREWIEFKMGDSAEAIKLTSLLTEEYERLFVQDRVLQAWKWARLYGGAGILLAVDDGQEDLKEPLDLNSIRSIKSMTVLSRWELSPVVIDRDLESNNFGMPEVYSLSPRTSTDTTAVMVHWTRIIRFEGVPLPRILFQANNWWGDSVFNRLWNPLRNFNLSHDSVASVMQDFKIGILKIQDLADLVASDNVKAFKARLEMMDLAKSVLGTIAIDAESEDFQNLTTSLAGVDKVLQEVSARLVPATGMPHTVVLGEGASGQFNNSGESEDRQLKDMVAAEQERVARPPLQRIFEIVQSQKLGPTRGRISPDGTFVFKPLWQMDQKEMAEIRKTMSEADERYLLNGVLSPDEVAKSRFGGEEFSVDTEIEVNKERLAPENLRITPEQIQDTEHHGHPDPLGGFTGSDLLEGPNHHHQRPNGMPTGEPILLPGGGHIHRAGGPDKFTGRSVFLSDIERIKSIELESDASHPSQTKKKKKKDIIEKRGNKFVILSKEASEVLGEFGSEKEAKKRLAQIEFFKNKEDKGQPIAGTVEQFGRRWLVFSPQREVLGEFPNQAEAERFLISLSLFSEKDPKKREPQ